MSSDDKILTRTGGVEVVADRSDDGTFEIRLERQHDSVPPTTDAVQVPDTGAWRAESQPTRARNDRQLVWYAAAAGIGVAALAGVFLVASWSSGLSGASPKTREVATAPAFRGFVVERTAPEDARNVRFAFDTDEQVDGATTAPGVIDGPPSSVDFANGDAFDAGVRMAEAYSGGPTVAPSVDVDPSRERALSQAEALDELERRLVDLRTQREARQNDAMAPEQDPAEEGVDDGLVDDEDEYYEDE